VESVKQFVSRRKNPPMIHASSLFFGDMALNIMASPPSTVLYSITIKDMGGPGQRPLILLAMGLWVMCNISAWQN